MRLVSNRSARRCWVTAASWVGIFGFCAAAHAAPCCTLVGNKSTGVTSMTKQEVRDAFTGKRKLWSKNSSVVHLAYRQGDGEDIQWLSGQVFGAPVSAVLAKIKLEVFKGELAKPAVVGSYEDVVKQVQSDKGAIGIVSLELAQKLPDDVVAVAVTEN